jgi:protein-tyrosine-phosphatase
MKFKIVFVCGGNTCRSPMAAGLAAAALKDIATVSSAGVEAWGQPASPKTLELMQRRHGIDLSAHRSRDIEDVVLDDVDFVVTMKPRYADRLINALKVPSEKVIAWNVEDPLVEGTDAAYERCLARLERLVEEFARMVRTEQ